MAVHEIEWAASREKKYEKGRLTERIQGGVIEISVFEWVLLVGETRDNRGRRI